MPGHNKYDYHYSIGKLKPDIVVNLGLGLWQSREEAFVYLNKDYKTIDINGSKIFCRKVSTNIKKGVLQDSKLINDSR